ncbi:MAG: type II toxin-antitoxin system RelE/ParE family toxin [Mobiluncus sp.]|uniref:Type II toxin-antitoxin system RelE/ParE family toxin n=1 Tax=Mobiluncus porci TaxID=2652278 RepID=A0A7K0K364_9ACTO|nr:MULTISPECIES: type II toxin-antitoxin system RelE/ParE family toxin [Mobiluncus]MCI6583782.1 type II toxin-antitoxin system RelE/ParE family toxin [Mobiluncus sp.]MST49936.1 type II toxin-antitoxin system RelE/ParE family toxin [Mobiluncus porci]
MKCQVQYSDDAIKELRKVYWYIAVNIGVSQTAAEQYERLEKAIGSLDEMPYRFRQWETEPWRSRGLRVMGVDNYVVLYVPDDDSMTVTVQHIFYGGADIESRLKDES